MTLSEIANLRLVNQKVIDSDFNSAKEVVSWLGAVQAQDFHMAKWALGIRVKSSSTHQIEESINNGEIIRTHVMRPTWHFTLAEDIRWMLELTSPHIKSTMKSYNVKLGLDEKLFSRTNKIIENLLVNRNYSTRQEIVGELKKKKILVDNFQASHVMFDAELNGIVCNGPMRGKQFTYALMDERISPTKRLTREESLSRIAKKYFTSHGPATIHDFIWWSGLPAADARVALEMVKREFISEVINDKTFWFASFNHQKISTGTLFLPAYDEFMISYNDRTASLDPKFSKWTLVGNGIFRPIIVADGKIIGIWLRTVKKNHVSISTKFFSSKQKLKKPEIKSLLQPYSNFLGMDMKL